MDLVQEQEFYHGNNGLLAKLPTIIVKTVVTVFTYAVNGSVAWRSPLYGWTPPTSAVKLYTENVWKLTVITRDP